MTYRSDISRGRKIIERWCVLAEQRLEYLTDLFETGRWRRYYNEITFLENIEEAKAAVETWRLLLNQEASRDNTVIDTSWLDRNILPRRPSILRDEIRPVVPRSLQLAAAPPAGELVAETPAEEPVSITPATEDAEHPAWARGLDLSVMQQRYPLLRHAL
jgi:uncharacterized repeat protein (TIGR03809 family)